MLCSRDAVADRAPHAAKTARVTSTTPTNPAPTRSTRIPQRRLLPSQVTSSSTHCSLRAPRSATHPSTRERGGLPHPPSKPKIHRHRHRHRRPTPPRPHHPPPHHTTPHRTTPLVDRGSEHRLLPIRFSTLATSHRVKRPSRSALDGTLTRSIAAGSTHRHPTSNQHPTASPSTPTVSHNDGNSIGGPDQSHSDRPRCQPDETGTPSPT